MRKTCIERQKISLVNDVKIRKRLEEKLIELVDVGAPNLWENLMNGVIRACDKECWKKRGGDACW